MCFLSRITHVHIGICDATCSSWCTTVLASKIPRSLANWTRMGHDEAGTYSFSGAGHNHCWIAITGAWCLGQSIAGWHSAPLWPFAYDNTRLNCHQRRVHRAMMWLSEFITYSLNDKLPVTSIFNTMNLSLRALHFFQQCIYNLKHNRHYQRTG